MMKPKETLPKHTPLALYAAGFRSPEEVRAAIHRLHSRGTTSEEAWDYATDRMLMKHNTPLDPKLPPNKNTWRLLVLVARLAKDHELEAIAKAQLDHLQKPY